MQEAGNSRDLRVSALIFCSPKNVDQLMEQLPEAKVIGEVAKPAGGTRVVINWLSGA